MTLSAMSRFAADWFTDASREASPDSAGNIGARRREIVLAACCAESYLVEWAADVLDRPRREDREDEEFDPNETPYSALQRRLRKTFPKPELTNALSIAKKARLEIESAKEKILAGDASGWTEFESATEKVRKIETLSVQNHTQDWIEVPRKLYELGYLQTNPDAEGSGNPPEFEELFQRRNDIIHANISWPQGLGPDPNDNREPRTTPTTLVNIHPGWAVIIVANRIQQLHGAINTPAPQWARWPPDLDVAAE